VAMEAEAGMVAAADQAMALQVADSDILAVPVAQQVRLVQRRVAVVVKALPGRKVV